MSKILTINGPTVKVGTDEGKIKSVPLASLSFSDPKVGDEVEIFSDGQDLIVNRVGSKTKVNFKKPKINKKVLIIGGIIIAIIGAAVCAIVFLPLAFDEDLRNVSNYPEYFKNAKEEKEAFANALSACNAAARTKMKSNGVTVEYDETDINAAGSHSVEDNHLTLYRVNPTGGDTEYKTYGKRYYSCETSIDGKTVSRVSILWDEKD